MLFQAQYTDISFFFAVYANGACAMSSFPDLMGCHGYHLVPLAMVQFAREPENLTPVAEA